MALKTVSNKTGNCERDSKSNTRVAVPSAQYVPWIKIIATFDPVFKQSRHLNGASVNKTTQSTRTVTVASYPGPCAERGRGPGDTSDYLDAFSDG